MSDLDNRTEWPEHEREAPMTSSTSSALTRDQVEECIEGGDAEMFLKHDAALRLTITQQAQEIERIRKERDEHLAAERKLEEIFANARQQLATAQARVTSLETTLFHSDVVKQRETITQLQATLAAWEKELQRAKSADPKVSAGHSVSCCHNAYWQTLYGYCMACRAEQAETDLTAAVQRAERAEARVRELEGKHGL